MSNLNFSLLGERNRTKVLALFINQGSGPPLHSLNYFQIHRLQFFDKQQTPHDWRQQTKNVVSLEKTQP